MDLNEIAIFVKVIQSGSFSGAAKELGLPKSTVSAKVSDLEARLGVTLIERTTRKLFITEAGKIFFDRCLIGLHEFEAAKDELHSSLSEPQGLLKITAPVELGNFVLPSIISRFTKKFPKVNIELILTDRKVDLLSEGVDLAIRAGHLKDSSLIAKKLGSVHFSLFVGKNYLPQIKNLETPDDLVRHDALLFTPFGNEWTLNKDKKQKVVRPKSKIMVNDLNVLRALTISGGGVALLPSFICHEEIKNKKLHPVLPDWISDYTPVQFVYPAQKFVKPKLREFIAFSSDEIKNSLEKVNSLIH
jgi:DNA-binding transcriptional LysR family regulator